MNILDLIIGIILILFAIIGLKRGLIIEAFYLASFIIGIYGAMYLSDVVANWMFGFVDGGKKYIAVIAFIVTFVIFVVLIRILAQLITKLFHAISLGFFNRVGGFFFGLLKGALITSVIILILNVFHITSLISKDLRRSSVLYTYTESIARILYKNHEVVAANDTNTCSDAFTTKIA